MKKHPHSMRMGLLTTVLICWLVPIVIIVVLAGILLGNSYENTVQAEIDSASQLAMRQVQNRFSNAVDDSKAVSYDGVIRSAYRSYQEDNDEAMMYRTINDYLTQKFSRNNNYRAVFITYCDRAISVNPYVQTDGTALFADFHKYTEFSDRILEYMAEADTSIRLMELDGELCMVRNLVDTHFEPYACIVIVFDSEMLFQSLQAISRISQVNISVDGLNFAMDELGNVVAGREANHTEDAVYTTSVGDHTISLSAMVSGFELWQDTPWMGWMAIAVALLVLPMLAFAILLFYRHVTMPMRTLIEANGRVRAGERGYQIDVAPENQEFSMLYDNFNAMSVELKSQFERSYLEQQAAQKAKIEALQSQINPHFLNNTLEIINWEARLADNERVCAMIEALSTMLNAALNRDARTEIPLREELIYVDAYLYIIKERLGAGVCVSKDIDETVTDQPIPSLILQPLVENAIEHDISSRRGGEVVIRAYSSNESLVLEVEHDGTMTDQDRENIRHQIYGEGTKQGSGMGIRNVAQRLRLIYGDKGSLTIEENNPGRILARIVLPK